MIIRMWHLPVEYWIYPTGTSEGEGGSSLILMVLVQVLECPFIYDNNNILMVVI